MGLIGIACQNVLLVNDESLARFVSSSWLWVYCSTSPPSGITGTGSLALRSTRRFLFNPDSKFICWTVLKLKPGLSHTVNGMLIAAIFPLEARRQKYRHIYSTVQKVAVQSSVLSRNIYRRRRTRVGEDSCLRSLKGTDTRLDCW